MTVAKQDMKEIEILGSKNFDIFLWCVLIFLLLCVIIIALLILKVIIW